MDEKFKQLLLTDLCARLPHRVKVVDVDENNEPCSRVFELHSFDVDDDELYGCVRPYLRPLSSMTEEEQYEYNTAIDKDVEPERFVDWFNAHHFDYRGLIEKGLALTAPEGMYDLK